MKILVRIKEAVRFFFDISKAFDKVWHNGLLFKLENLGVCKVIKKWIAAFLSNRFGYVSVDGV